VAVWAIVLSGPLNGRPFTRIGSAGVRSLAEPTAGSPAARDGGLPATVAVLALVMFVLLTAIGDGARSWPASNPVYRWVTLCTLNLLPAGVILWDGIWHRWPLPTPDATTGRTPHLQVRQ
jgi:hypothetical protein